MFEIDVLEAANKYVTSGPELLRELSRARDALDREMEISRRVTTSIMEEINLGLVEAPQPLSIAKDLTPTEQ